MPVKNIRSDYISYGLSERENGNVAEAEKRTIDILLSKYFSNILFKITLVNKFRIGSLCIHKDKLPKPMRVSLVYKFRCAQCASEYVGSTTRTLHSRVAEHAGRSFRTEPTLTFPSQSVIRTH